MGENEVQTAFKTETVRCAFPHLFKPQKAEGAEGEPKYQLTLLYPKDADISKFKRAALAVANEKWGDKATRDKKRIKIEWPWKDGNQKSNLEGYEGHWYFNLTSKRKPQVMGFAGGQLVPITDESAVYGGMHVKVMVHAFTWEFMGKKGVSFGLGHVLKVKDDESFGGSGVRAEEAFADDEGEDFGGDEFDEIPY